MTINRTTITGIHGMPQALAGLEASAGLGRRAREATLAVLTLGLLLLVAL